MIASRERLQKAVSGTRDKRARGNLHGAFFKRMAKDNDLSVVEARYYFVSSYFSFFFPIYFLWRLWILLFRAIRGDQAAETFSMVLKKDVPPTAVSE